MQFPSAIDLNTTFKSNQYTYLHLIKFNVSAISLRYLAASQHSSNFIDQTLRSLILGDISDIVYGLDDRYLLN